MIKSLKRYTNRTLRHFGYEFARYPSPGLIGGHLQSLLGLYPINCVIDVGAGRGQYGSVLRQIGYQGRIVSFEPVQASYNRVLQSSRNDPAWAARRLALGSESHSLAINITGHPGMCSFLQPSPFALACYGREAKVTRTEEVPMTRLDSVFDEVVAGIDEPRVYLKMDTQGFDFDVIEGAAGCLNRVVALQTEVAVKHLYEGMHGYQEVISYLQGRGFHISGIFPVAMDERDLTAVEFDCVMVRPERAG